VICHISAGASHRRSLHESQLQPPWSSSRAKQRCRWIFRAAVTGVKQINIFIYWRKKYNSFRPSRWSARNPIFYGWGLLRGNRAKKFWMKLSTHSLALCKQFQFVDSMLFTGSQLDEQFFRALSKYFAVTDCSVQKIGPCAYGVSGKRNLSSLGENKLLKSLNMIVCIQQNYRPIDRILREALNPPLGPSSLTNTVLQWLYPLQCLSERYSLSVRVLWQLDNLQLTLEWTWSELEATTCQRDELSTLLDNERQLNRELRAKVGTKT